MPSAKFVNLLFSFVFLKETESSLSSTECAPIAAESFALVSAAKLKAVDLLVGYDPWPIAVAPSPSACSALAANSVSRRTDSSRSC